MAPAVYEAVGAARGRVGLDTAAVAPRARRAVPKEAGGHHRAVGTLVGVGVEVTVRGWGWGWGSGCGWGWG